MITGSGPIISGQACELDYSGARACKALRGLGYEIVPVNSNPATIMTDPGTADVTCIDPLNIEADLVELKRTACDLVSVTGNIEETFRPAAEEKGLGMSLAAPGVLCLTSCGVDSRAKPVVTGAPGCILSVLRQSRSR